MKRILLAALAVALVMVAPAYGATSVRHDNYPLHVGSAGPRCEMGKFLIRKPRPAATVFKQITGTYLPRWGMGGYCNAHFGTAVEAYKWRLGYPKKWVKPVVGHYFIDLLRGDKKQPVAWVLVAAARLKAIEATTPTIAAVRWKQLLISWLGIKEVPDGSNRGPCISYSCSIAGHDVLIQRSTGQYGAAWCVSTEQEAALIVLGHVFADGTAGVYYAVDYAHAKGWLSAKAKFGSLVAFLTLDRYGNRVPGTGHMGFVSKVTSGGFSYIAGNDANGVNERYITFGARPYVFIRLPGVA